MLRMIKIWMVLLALVFIHVSCSSAYKSVSNTPVPKTFLGNFEDDYGIQYTFTPKKITQHKNIRYHVLQWNVQEGYIIAQNDTANPGEPGLYTRIDYVLLNNMQPYNWAFCYTTYNATSAADAIAKNVADKTNPRKGCNGFPFSRMKKMLR